MSISTPPPGTTTRCREEHGALIGEDGFDLAPLADLGVGPVEEPDSVDGERDPFAQLDEEHDLVIQ